jgi:hypothetical protein
MLFSKRIRTTLVALIAIVGLGIAGSPSWAGGGKIDLWWIKAGWFIGGAGGSGTLVYHGRHYDLAVGGISAGATFGIAEANLSGSVSNINSPSDVAGVYGAAGAGIVAGHGPGLIVLTNEKGAVLELQGEQTGLMFNADLSGLIIKLD